MIESPWRIEARPAALQGVYLSEYAWNGIFRLWRECLDEGEEHNDLFHERLTTGRYTRADCDRECEEARAQATEDAVIEVDWWIDCGLCGEQILLDCEPASGNDVARWARHAGYHRIRASRSRVAVWVCGPCWHGEGADRGAA